MTLRERVKRRQPVQQAELVALSLTRVLITEKLPGKASLQQEKSGSTERFADFFFPM